MYRFLAVLRNICGCIPNLVVFLVNAFGATSVGWDWLFGPAAIDFGFRWYWRFKADQKQHQRHPERKAGSKFTWNKLRLYIEGAELLPTSLCHVH